MSRPKGSTNKKTAEDFFKLCKRLKFDPVEFAVRVAQNDWSWLGYDRRTYTDFNKFGDEVELDHITMELRLTANKQLLDFMYPKRKSIELPTDQEPTQNNFIVAYNIDQLANAADQANVLQLRPPEKDVTP